MAEDGSASPLLQRVRVAKACDECRKRKQKCDGKKPCHTCTAHGRKCTFNRAHGSNNMSAWQRIEILEDRLQRAQHHLKELLAVNCTPPSADVKEILQSPSKIGGSVHQNSQDDHTSEDDGEYLDVLDTYEEQHQPNVEYYGRSSGHAFLQATRGFFDGEAHFPAKNSDPQLTDEGKKIKDLFDSPLPRKESLKLDVPVSHLLPPYQIAQSMINNLFVVGWSWMNFLHRPTFEQAMERIYCHEAMKFTDEDYAFIPLLYVMLGLAFLFSREQHQMYGHERSVWQGMRHFVAAQKMIDVIKCRDLLSLQAVICMIVFLQSTARISTCHSYIGIAVTLATKLGLHRRAPDSTYNPIERETRKRMFWTIQRLDAYVAAIRGLPRLLHLECVNQEMPLEVGDEHITSEPISLPIGTARDPCQAASNAHTALQIIMTDVVEHLYAVKNIHPDVGTEDKARVVSYSRIQKLEDDLDRWQRSILADANLYFGDRARHSLGFQLQVAHAHVRIFLYRPFLHYLAKSNRTPSFDARKSRLAVACVKTSRDLIKIVLGTDTTGFLYAASWPVVYAIFLAAVSILFYSAAGAESPDQADASVDYDRAVALLKSLPSDDLGPAKCIKVLEVLRRSLMSNRRDDGSEKNAPLTNFPPFTSPTTIGAAPAVSSNMIPTLFNMNTSLDSPLEPIPNLGHGSMMSTSGPSFSLSTTAGNIAGRTTNMDPRKDSTATTATTTSNFFIPDMPQNMFANSNSVYSGTGQRGAADPNSLAQGIENMDMEIDSMSIPYMDSLQNPAGGGLGGGGGGDAESNLQQLNREINDLGYLNNLWPFTPFGSEDLGQEELDSSNNNNNNSSTPATLTNTGSGNSHGGSKNGDGGRGGGGNVGNGGR